MAAGASVGEWIGIAIIVGLKFGLPLLFLRFPFAAGWANFVLDSIDGDLLVPLGLSDAVYQPIDKGADWVSYVFMVLAARAWPIRRAAVALFALRSIGQGLFFATGDERVFFLFPNFLEPLFLAYATIRVARRAEAEAFYMRHRLAVWLIVFLYKMQDEWVTHIGNVDRTELIRGLFR